MSRHILGLVIGAAAGILDVIPMLLQKLTWDANLSAFTMWVVVGFLAVSSDLKMPGVLEGILLAFLCLLPSGILIGWKTPGALLPIAVMTTVLGGFLGFCVERAVGRSLSPRLGAAAGETRA